MNVLDNKITNKGLNSLSGNIKDLNDLKILHINMDWNTIGGEGAKDLAQVVAKLHGLTSLNLEFDYN